MNTLQTTSLNYSVFLWSGWVWLSGRWV